VLILVNCNAITKIFLLSLNIRPFTKLLQKFGAIQYLFISWMQSQAKTLYVERYYAAHF